MLWNILRPWTGRYVVERLNKMKIVKPQETEIKSTPMILSDPNLIQSDPTLILKYLKIQVAKLKVMFLNEKIR